MLKLSEITIRGTDIDMDFLERAPVTHTDAKRDFMKLKHFCTAKEIVY